MTIIRNYEMSRRYEKIVTDYDEESGSSGKTAISNYENDLKRYHISVFITRAIIR